MKNTIEVGPTHLIDDSAEYVVVAISKDDGSCRYVKFRGTYDECADYAERNTSPDNGERYHVAFEVG